MCGIAGAINYQYYNLEKAKNALFHRGPDEQKIETYDNIAFIHTRLAIQDIYQGHQPFSYKHYTIIFNGEIYNHIDLRKELHEYTFTSTSDTETLLYLYIKFGQKMFEKIDGMFAFCIYDKTMNKLILAKDRAGKKPLYLFRDNNSVFFASELNAIKAASNRLEIDEVAITSYLRNGLFFKSYTPYKGVISLDAGSLYSIDISTLEIETKQYFNILQFYKNGRHETFDEALLKLDNIIHKSIQNRLVSSDLEVGAFLSGGIDSSLIVAIASEYRQNLKTFTVKFKDGYDESYLARLTASKYKTNHTEIDISLDLKQDIEKILFNYGKPFMDSSAIPSYYVSLEAKKHVTVVLNGDGADEIFGGYRRYVPIANNILGIAKKISFLIKMIPMPNNKKTLYNYFFRLLAMSGKNGLDLYNSATIDIFEDIYQFSNNPIFDEMEQYIHSIQIDPLSKMLYLDFNILLFSNLLEKMDIATMSHSLEARSPFLSKYILEYVPTLQNSYKINGKKTKYILRELSKKYLPKELINQPKRGFEVPLVKWIEDDLKENIFDTLKNDSYSSNFIQKDFIQNLLAKKVNVSDEKRAKMLWTMYSLEIWKNNQ